MDEHQQARRKLMQIGMLGGAVGAVTLLAAYGVHAFAADTNPAISPVIGKAAPIFSGMTSNGEKISLDQFNHKIVVLEWTNDGCPFVQKHYEGGNMQVSQKVAAADDDVVWISVISSAPGKQGHVSGERANELSVSRGAVPDYIILDEDGIMGRQYEAKTTPHIYVVDGSGILQYMGAMDDKPSAKAASLEGATNYALGALSSVKSGVSPDPAQTRPYGCSVKYGS